MDIVERLRSYRPPYGWPEEYSIIVEPTLNHVAADEIERLRKALTQVVVYYEGFTLTIEEVVADARAALKGGE